MSTEETGAVTGTRDKDYNLVWYAGNGQAAAALAAGLPTGRPGRKEGSIHD